MSPNSFGRLFKVTTFGESHGAALGAVIEGCPAGVEFNLEILKEMLERRRPGASAITSSRSEADAPEVLSGVYQNKTLGTPIAIIVRNQDARSEDYKFIDEGAFRKGHSEDLWKQKFGHFDSRGGGRSSGRETLSRVLGGAVAKMFLRAVYPIEVSSRALNVGPLSSSDKDFSEQLEALLLKAKEEGKSYGGVAEIRIQKAPSSLGEPVFAKLKSELASAMLSVGATVGFELGAGFASAETEGTSFHSTSTSSDQYGGIRGGISSGEEIVFRMAVKPTSSVLDVAKKGRHDPCILLRALVVFEAMSWLVLADMLLQKQLNKIESFKSI